MFHFLCVRPRAMLHEKPCCDCRRKHLQVLQLFVRQFKLLPGSVSAGIFVFTRFKRVICVSDVVLPGEPLLVAVVLYPFMDLCGEGVTKELVNRISSFLVFSGF